MVKSALDRVGIVPKGSFELLHTPGHAFERVLFLETGPLFRLYYTELRDFGFRLARLASQDQVVPGGRIAMTLHGVL